MKVDGQWISAANLTIPSGTAGSRYYTKIDFGSEAVRRIEIFFDDAYRTGGFTIDKFRDIWPLNFSSIPQVMVIGDSYTMEANATTLRGGFVYQMGDALGLPNIIANGQGGCGYLATNGGGRKTFRQRIADFGPAGPFASADLVAVFGGINDYTANAAALQAEVTQFFTELKALRPDAIIACFGPWTAPGKVVPQAISDAVKNGFAAVIDPTRMFYVDVFGESWQTGTTYNLTGTEDGNAYRFIGSDATHPNNAGYQYLGTRAAMAMKAGLKALPR